MSRRQDLVGTWVALLLLTGATVAFAHVDLGAWNLVIALALALAKATLLALVYMDLREVEPAPRAYAVGGIAWATVLLVLVALEVVAR